MTTIEATASRKLLLFVAVLAICVHRPQCVNQEGNILLEFKQQVKDPGGALRNWNAADATPCNWAGITCENDRVLKILIDDAELRGSIADSLGQLPFLRTLSLAGNRFDGEIPAQISGILGLMKLNLSRNSFNGGIPLSIARLRSLRMLDLSSNRLTGIIPDELFQDCGHLRYISLANNSLLGTIAPSLGSCTSIEGIDFSSNGLLGSVPASLGQLKGLEFLLLQQNSFTGSIPPQLGSCTRLRLLNLSRNLLRGPLPRELGLLPNLTELYVNDNKLSDAFPQEVLYLASLEYLNASRNSFRGGIPGGVGCGKLTVLDLSKNQLVEDISADLFDCQQLKLLNLSHNQLRDIVPLAIGGLSLLHTLDLSSNNLTGTIPDGIQELRNLAFLDLGSNPISGSIPDGIGEMPLLQVAHLDHMLLRGEIPSSIGQCQFLLALDLSNNKLEGTIPTSLANLTYLNTLELQDNNLHGLIPRELAQLVHLKKLDLSFNNLTGTVPSELGELKALAHFNVSFNNLTGPIPRNGIMASYNSTSYAGNPSLCGLPLPLKCSPMVSTRPQGPPPPMPPPPAAKKRHVLSISSILAITAAAIVALGILVVTICNLRARKPQKKTELLVYESTTASPPTSPRVGKLVLFSTTIACKQESWNQGVTALVDKGCIIGYGPLGTVNKAMIDGVPYALKRLEHLGGVKSQDEFEREVKVLGNLRHRNLVTFEGYYWSSETKVLLSQYLPNDSLFHHLHNRLEGQPALPWWRRFKVAQGTARALAYLHHDCRPPILLFNLKATNILLDEEFEPHISDYGLRKMLPKTNADAYTSDPKLGEAVGYMAPEMLVQNPRLTEKCDVYSFGVILLELVTGQRPVENLDTDIVVLCDFARKLWMDMRADRCFDPELDSLVDQQEMMLVLRVGLACTSQEPAKRPTMAEVVQMLELHAS